MIPGRKHESYVRVDGVISFGASRRLREIAIRMSLGASRASVIRLVLRDATVVAGTGMALGLFASVVVTRPLALFLVDGLSVHDPLSYVATMFVLAAVALAASWIPAWRAARTDPMAFCVATSGMTTWCNCWRSGDAGCIIESREPA